jgi:excisionase family DNA binding protein
MAELTAKTYLTVEDLMEILHVSRGTIYEYKRDGKLPDPITMGKRLLWRSDDVDEFLKQKGQ